CGACCEHGGDPLSAGPALLDRLPAFLTHVREYHELCRQRYEAEEEQRPAQADGEEEEPPSADDLAQRYLEALFPEHPQAVWAYVGIEEVSLGAIAHLSRSPALRATARGRPELLPLSQAADAASHGVASFLTKMLRVLDEEPLLVLHPGQ